MAEYVVDGILPMPSISAWVNRHARGSALTSSLFSTPRKIGADARAVSMGKTWREWQGARRCAAREGFCWNARRQLSRISLSPNNKAEKKQYLLLLI